jgi:hypothetical protein
MLKVKGEARALGGKNWFRVAINGQDMKHFKSPELLGIQIEMSIYETN